jgi:hypothetical protein
VTPVWVDSSMPPKSLGATVVVHMADARRTDLVLARITSRRDDRPSEISEPLLTTADELADRVRELVARLGREVIRG